MQSLNGPPFKSFPDEGSIKGSSECSLGASRAEECQSSMHGRAKEIWKKEGISRYVQIGIRKVSADICKLGEGRYEQAFTIWKKEGISRHLQIGRWKVETRIFQCP